MEGKDETNFDTPFMALGTKELVLSHAEIMKKNVGLNNCQKPKVFAEKLPKNHAI